MDGRHCYFTGGQDPYKRLRQALKADVDEEAWASLNRTVSSPFPKASTGRIAVKVINDYGDPRASPRGPSSGSDGGLDREQAFDYDVG